MPAPAAKHLHRPPGPQTCGTRCRPGPAGCGQWLQRWQQGRPRRQGRPGCLGRSRGCRPHTRPTLQAPLPPPIGTWWTRCRTRHWLDGTLRLQPAAQRSAGPSAWGPGPPTARADSPPHQRHAGRPHAGHTGGAGCVPPAACAQQHHTLGPASPSQEGGPTQGRQQRRAVGPRQWQPLVRLASHLPQRRHLHHHLLPQPCCPVVEDPLLVEAEVKVGVTGARANHPGH